LRIQGIEDVSKSHDFFIQEKLVCIRYLHIEYLFLKVVELLVLFFDVGKNRVRLFRNLIHKIIVFIIYLTFQISLEIGYFGLDFKNFFVNGHDLIKEPFYFPNELLETLVAFKQLF
jgi:hypothetical protein